MGILRDLGLKGTKILPCTIKLTTVRAGRAGELSRYEVLITESPAGTKSEQVDVDLTKLREDAAALDVVSSQVIDDPEGVYTRGIGSKEPPAYSTDPMKAANELGERLFDLAIRPVFWVVKDSIAFARNQKRALLRINLWLPPELMGLPWEFLRTDDATLQLPLCQTPGVSVSRFVDVGLAAESLEFDAPIRVLGVPASPRDMVKIDVAEEMAAIDKGLADLPDGAVEIKWTNGTWRDLVAHLEPERGRWDVLHFTGHGAFDTDASQSMLFFNKDADGTESHRVFPGVLNKQLLSSPGAPRLVILNSCEGAKGADGSHERDRGSQASKFSSTAASLIGSGRAGVVAMQYEVTLGAAEVFAREFYGPLASGETVDEAVWNARGEISKSANGAAGQLEWVTPVFYSQREPVKETIDVKLFFWGVAVLVLTGMFMGESGRGVVTYALMATPFLAIGWFGYRSQNPKSELDYRSLAVFGAIVSGAGFLIASAQQDVLRDAWNGIWSGITGGRGGLPIDQILIVLGLAVAVPVVGTVFAMLGGWIGMRRALRRKSRRTEEK